MIDTFCPNCGQKLVKKEIPNEGKIPYCGKCKEYHFPSFSNAVQVVLFSPEQDKVLLIKQYGRDRYILPAGYVNLGEGIEKTVERELNEELGITVQSMDYQYSSYFEPSDTLMFVFSAISDRIHLDTNEEIDDFRWCTPKEAEEFILKDSLAEKSVHWVLDKQASVN